MFGIITHIKVFVKRQTPRRSAGTLVDENRRGSVGPSAHSGVLRKEAAHRPARAVRRLFSKQDSWLTPDVTGDRLAS